MKSNIALLMSILLAFPVNSFGVGKIQDSDVKSLADIKAVISITGNLTSGSACIASPSSTTGISAGLYAYDATTSTNIGSGVTVVGVPGTCSAGQIQLSANAAGNGTGDTITFGGQASQLINDTKIWASSVTPAQTLSSAISTGAIGGTAGTKNYLTTYKGNTGNGNFEFGNTTGWSLGTISTITNGLPTSTPTFGSGANANLSIGVVSTGQIAGNYSLSYSSSTATTAGNMLASSSFAIDTEDQAKVMTVKYYYNVNSGASNDNFSGTSSNSFGWAAWDVTNSVWLSSTGNFCMTQNSGAGYCTGTVQTGATTANIRFVMYNANITSGATTLYMDDFFFGPQTAPFGPAMTDWIAYTPTGSWTTNTTYTGFYKRVGDTLMAKAHIVLSGAPNASTTLTVNIPSGLAIDTTKLTSGPSAVHGSGSITHSAGGYALGGVVYSSTTAVLPTSPVTSSGTNPVAVNEGVITSVAPVTFASGDSIDLEFQVPITGWSSNSAMSSDTDTRVVAMQTNTTASATLSSTASVVKFSGVVQDNTGSYNTSTGLFTVPVTGYYQIQSGLNISGTISANLYATLGIAQNGTVGQTSSTITAASQTNAYVTLSATLYAKAGDTLAPYASTNITSPTVSSFIGNLNYFNVNRISGPSVIAATESVNSSYNTSSTTIGTTPTVVVATNKLFDSHNAYSTSTGLYTCPVAGKFRISGSYIGSAVTANAINQGVQALIQKNGTTVSQAYTLIYQQTSTAVNPTGSLSATIACNAGDTLGFALQRDSGVNSFAVQSTASFTNISIERVGN